MLAKCTAPVGIPCKFKARDEVVAERNFGEFVNETDRATLDQACLCFNDMFLFCVNIFSSFPYQDPRYMFQKQFHVLGQCLNPLGFVASRQVLTAVVGSSPITEQRPTLNLIPNHTLKEFWLPLIAFDVSARSKSGCGGFKSFTIFKFYCTLHCVNDRSHYVFSQNSLQPKRY